MKEYVMDKIWALVFKKKFKEGLQWVNIPVIVSYQTKEYEAPKNIKDFILKTSNVETRKSNLCTDG